MAVKPLTIGTAAGYTGVVRRGRTIVFECGHSHANRDFSTRLNGMSARDCITIMVRATRHPETMQWQHNRIRETAAHNARLLAATQRQVDQFHARAAEAIEAFDATVNRLRELLGDDLVLDRRNAAVNR